MRISLARYIAWGRGEQAALAKAVLEKRFRLRPTASQMEKPKARLAVDPPVAAFLATTTRKTKNFAPKIQSLDWLGKHKPLINDVYCRPGKVDERG
jgi:hypothetical protein